MKKLPDLALNQHKAEQFPDQAVSQRKELNDADERWKTVNNKKTRRQQNMQAIPNALIIKKKGEVSFAEILSRIKKDSKRVKKDQDLEEVGKNVHKARRTAAGDLMFILEKKTAKEKTGQLRLMIEGKLIQKAEVSSRVQKMLIDHQGRDLRGHR